MDSVITDDGTEYTGTQILGLQHSTTPLIVCFHGSGESCASWLPLAKILSENYRVLLYDREHGNAKPKQTIAQMAKYLEDHNMKSPWVLVAHSYGGCFAREFLQKYKDHVVGMVLAETGQETPVDPKLDEKQCRQKILGKKPLSVIRCNSLIGKWAEYNRQVEVLGEAASSAEWIGRKQLLDAWDKQDETLKRKQLELSSNSRYVHLPTCGHHVIRDRPDVVADEIRWVMETWDTVGESKGIWQHLHELFWSMKIPKF